MHFQPPRNEMKCVLCIKESYSKGRKGQHFSTFAYGQAGSGDPLPPYGQPDRKILVFLRLPYKLACCTFERGLG